MRRVGWTVAVVCAGAALASPPGSRTAEPTEQQHTNSLKMKLVRIGPGEFLMGQGDAAPKTREDWITRDSDEAPAHRVTITKAFYLGATEVTNASTSSSTPSTRSVAAREARRMRATSP